MENEPVVEVGLGAGGSIKTVKSSSSDVTVATQFSEEGISSSKFTMSTLTPQSHSTPRQQDRKTLQTLQHAADGGGRLNGGKHQNKHQTIDSKMPILRDGKSPFMISPHGGSIFHDPESVSSTKVHCSRMTQTDSALLDDLVQQHMLQVVDCPEDSGVQSASESQETLDLLVSEKPSENYWKDLAEERRQALKETLEENEKLVNEVEHLKQENTRLTHVEQRAIELQKLLEDFLPDEDEDSNLDSQLDGSEISAIHQNCNETEDDA